MRSVCILQPLTPKRNWNWACEQDRGITQKEAKCVQLPRKSPCTPVTSCVLLACPDGWGLKDANVHAGATDLPQRLTLHQWKWKPVNQQAAVALIPTHHSLWHCQQRQEHINHKHRPQHCAGGTVVSHSFIHLAMTLTHTTYTQMMGWTAKDSTHGCPKAQTDNLTHTADTWLTIGLFIYFQVGFFFYF